MKTIQLLHPQIKPSEMETGSAWSRKRSILLQDIIRWALFFLAILFSGLSWTAAGQITDTSRVEVLLSAPMTAEEAADCRGLETQQEEPVRFSLWRMEEDAIVENAEWNRQTESTVLYLNGDSDLLIPADSSGSPVLKAEDTQGCLIDGETADRLFGDRQAAGSRIICGGKTYLVRGVLEDVRNTVILNASVSENGSGAEQAGQEEEGFRHMILQISDGSGGTLQAEEFLLRNGAEGTVAGGGTSAAAGLCASLFPLLLWIFLVKKYGSLMISCKEYPVLILIILSCILLITVLFVQLAGMKFQLPRDILPTSWSDFSFWGEWWKGQMEKFALTISMEKNFMDIRRIRLLAVSGLTGAGAVTCCLCSMRGAGKEKEKMGFLPADRFWLFWSAVTVVTWLIYTFLVFRSGTKGTGLAGHWGFWMLVPAWLLLQRGGEALEKKLGKFIS